MQPSQLYQALRQRLTALQQSGRLETLAGSKIGLEKESLRVTPEGGISQQPSPAAWGSMLTNPRITTDFSEALAELITPPCDSVSEVIASLDDIQTFVYRHLDNEILWATSMPCVVAGETSIPLAQYGRSNAATMKTVYRHGLGLRYGRAMQVIAGVHFNYSFSNDFWALLAQLENDNRPLQVFKNERAMGLVRNLLRFGWLVPYLFGASPAVCKSFLNGKRSLLQEFNANTFFEPWATSLRMGNIGYQNNKEDLAGIKACYDSVQCYAESLQCAISTPNPVYEKLGVKVDGVWRQLNANILQIENEYYSTVRPKPKAGDDAPARALLENGIEYIELRSLDVNAYDPHGIHADQLYFLEVLMLFCLLQPSPPLSPDEINAIDQNLLLVAHQGRKPGLMLQRDDASIGLQQWASELCNEMTGVARLLDQANFCDDYFSSVKTQIASVYDPDLTPSARMLAEMRDYNEGFFHYAQRMSKHHDQYYRQQHLPADRLQYFEQLAESSRQWQKQIEQSDNISFDEYLANYYRNAGVSP